MKKLNKLLIAAAAIVAGITLGVLLVSQSGSEYIDEQDARAMVTDRYAGKIDSISMSDDERFYIVNLKDGDYQYEIKVNRDDSSIENIVTEKVAQQEKDTAEKKESTEKKTEPEKDEKAKEKKAAESKDRKEKEAADTLITEDEAKRVAVNEVGGEFVHLTLNQNTHPKQYQIIQHVDDDDEGALVTVDAIAGEALKVLWFQIDFNNIADIEAFAQQLQDYNTQYQNNYYMEFGNDDDSDSDDNDYEDDEDDGDDSDDSDD